MTFKRILAISSSRAGNSGYLEPAAPLIKRFLGEQIMNIAFIPFASVNEDYEDYLRNVQEGLAGLPHKINLVNANNAKSVIAQANAIMVGGGNTFKLLHDIYRNALFTIIRDRIDEGIPYIGWSAGSNIAGLTIGTTNDMPIIEPQSFKALALFPFQINPHYININTEAHNGETRDQRLTEFTKMNPNVAVVCLPEGTALQLEGRLLTFVGHTAGVLFVNKTDHNELVREEIKPGADLSFLLK